MSKPKQKPVRETKGFFTKVCIIPGRLDNKLAIVTGANAGVGFYTTSELARRGCQVIMACRNRERAEAARNSILEKYGKDNPKCLEIDVAGDEVKGSLSAVSPDQLIIEQLDLASLTSVRSFVQRIQDKYSHLDFLINNAGLVSANYEQTEDHLEKTLGTNHLGPFLLTELLLPLLKKSGPARIIFVSSIAHSWGNLNRPDFQIKKEDYTLMKAYNQSKLANVVYAKELSRRLGDSQIIVASLHPGAVESEFQKNFGKGIENLVAFFFKPTMITPWEGAQTTMYTVLSPNIKSGSYYSNCSLTNSSQATLDENNQQWLRQKSCELVGLTMD